MIGERPAGCATRWASQIFSNNVLCFGMISLKMARVKFFTDRPLSARREAEIGKVTPDEFSNE
jgi:hypothetical protein